MSGERGFLCLADGTVFEGIACGAQGVSVGEVVFTTGMTGYQEVLTDPSYCGQIVTMTAPEIGNTGINDADDESVCASPRVAGFVVRDLSAISSNYRSTQTLDQYLVKHGIVAISGIDTRLLTRTIRDRGAQNGALGAVSPDEPIRRAREAPPMEGLDLVDRVTVSEPQKWIETSDSFRVIRPNKHAEGRHVVCLDLGVKRNILRSFVDLGCRLTVVPARTTAAEILDLDPDGVFISNGPGDPAAVSYAIDTVRSLVGKKPLFGICLGHQILALAVGGKTYKLKFGHRGLNQPVKDIATGRVEITTQNHGFAVDLASLGGKARTTHVHLDDGTSEGLELPELGAFSVQYHPEAAAGPHDAFYFVERFAMRFVS